MNRHTTAFGPVVLLSCINVLPLAAADPEQRTWAERFPAVAERVRSLDRRMASDDVAVRKRVLSELVAYRPRDSRAFPPFFLAVLKDQSPEIRGMAVEHLWEHFRFLKPTELPKSFHVSFVGEFHWQDPKELARVRQMAANPDAAGGWAIHALALVGDQEAIPLARKVLESRNVFTRFSAAMALVQLGEVKLGVDALHRLTDTTDDVSGFYRYRAGECLYRVGDREAGIKALLALIESKVRDDYVDRPQEILEDLTGQYFLTAAEGRKWWEKEKKRQK